MIQVISNELVNKNASMVVKSCGLSQRQVATFLDSSPTNVSRIVKMQKPAIRLDEGILLMKLADIRPSIFLYREISPEEVKKYRVEDFLIALRKQFERDIEFVNKV